MTPLRRFLTGGWIAFNPVRPILTGSAITPRTIATPARTQLLKAQFPLPIGICTGVLGSQADVICSAAIPGCAPIGNRRLT